MIYSSSVRNPLHLTNDWKQFVCDEHRDLDTSKLVVDMSAHIRMDDSCARIDGHRLTTREEWIATYKRWLADSRWTLINVPEWLLELDKREAARPGQLTLFEEK